MSPVRTLLLLLSVTFVIVFQRGGSAAAAGASEGLARLLENLPPDRIETGILYDRVLALSEIESHDGGEQSLPASRSEWRQIYHEISRASLEAPAWPSLERVNDRARAARRLGVVPIAVMNFRYDRIRPDAIDTGALAAQGDRLVVGTGDPFEVRRVFAAAAQTERTYRGSDVTFRLDRDDYYTNDQTAPKAVEIDFDDGRGFVAAPFGQALPVSYVAAGKKSIRLRLALDDGSQLSASFPFDVISLGTPVPDDTLQITASIPYLGTTGSGEAYVYLAPGHTTLTSPILVVEGFDLDNSMNWDELYALLNREQLLENLRGLGFDAVILNFADATDYVQRNAYVIVEMIDQVNAMIDPAMSTAMVGASMGGLAGRYALAYMESEAVEHRVRTFISFDSPQSGASIPLGIQYWVAFFADDAPEAAALLAALDSPAAREMLVYHHTEPPGATGQSDPLRAGLLADLAALGDYPTSPRTVAIANGSGAQSNQGFNAGAQIIDWEYESFLIDITGNVWAVPDASSSTIFHGLVHVIFTSPDERIVGVGGTRPFDSAPGGSRASMAQMDATPAPFGDIVALHASHCFIPTVSALDLNTPDLFFDVANEPDLLALTPFDAVYFPQVNEEHVTITPQNAVWVTTELLNGITAVAQSTSIGSGSPILFPASPNPLRETTRLRFALPMSGPARLAVYDASGRQVAVLLDGHTAAGGHEATWDGSTPSGGQLGSGTYFLKLAAQGTTLTKKLVLVR